jgi:hypothetical protein
VHIAIHNGEYAWYIWWRYHLKWKRQKQSNPIIWYGKFGIAAVEIPLKRQITYHHAVARIFKTGLRNCWCTLP